MTSMDKERLQKLVEEYGTPQRTPQTVVCPFCAATYINSADVRSFVKCVYCDGSAQEAEEVAKAVQQLFWSLSESPDRRLIEMLVDALHAAPVRSKFRSLWNEKFGGLP